MVSQEDEEYQVFWKIDKDDMQTYIIYKIIIIMKNVITKIIMQAIWSDLPVPSYTYYDYTYYDSSTHSKSKWNDSKDAQEVHLFQSAGNW